MSPLQKGLLATGVLALLAWGGLQMREEHLAEQSREAVPQEPPRLDQGALLLSPEAEVLAGISTEPLVAAPAVAPAPSGDSASHFADAARAVLDAEDARFGHNPAPESRAEPPPEPVATVLLHEGALLRWDGKTWVYLQDGPGRFVRREVTLLTDTGNGWLASGIPTSGRVVVTGAQTLLSEEFRGSGEED